MRLTRAEIDLEALRFNYEAIKKYVGSNIKIMGIVKANAYGHGIIEIAKALVDYGIDYLGTGFLEEGILLRKNGINIPILVLGGVLGEQIINFLEYNLEITVSSIELAERIEQEVKTMEGRKAKVHLKIDTGMERIGVRAENAVQFIERVAFMKHLEIVGIYSHLASSDEKDKMFTYHQIKLFDDLLQKISCFGIDIPFKHIANSGAILDIPESYYNMVRPGILLYGLYPSIYVSQKIPLKPVLSLKSKIVYLKEVPAGVSISYGRNYVTTRKTKIATIPIGYGDGYSRRLTNKAEVIIKGKRYPVVGTICMDQIMVDVGIDADVHIGDDVVLIGSDMEQTISVWEIASKLETNHYEVLTGIMARVPRVILK